MLEQQIQASKKEAMLAISAKAELEELFKSTNKELANLKAMVTQNEETYKQKTNQLCHEFAHTESGLKKQLTISKW